MEWTGEHDQHTFYHIKTFFQVKIAGWPSGQRCRLASMVTRVRSQSKSKLFSEELTELIMNYFGI